MADDTPLAIIPERLKLYALEKAVRETYGTIPSYAPASRYGGCVCELVGSLDQHRAAIKTAYEGLKANG